METLSVNSGGQVGTSFIGKLGLVDPYFHFVMFRSIKNWSCKTNAQLFSGPTEYRFVNLSQVHTLRHTQWIQNNIHRTSVFQEWHIFFTYDTGHDALVSVAACHLISYLQLPLLGNIDLGHLDDARRQQLGRASCRERVCQYV